MLKQVMVYDNCPNILTLFDRILSNEGFEVMSSASPMNSFDIDPLQVDIIILGYIVGYLDHELDILRKLRQNIRTALIPVIICTTGALYIQNREEIINDHRLAVVSKPFAIEQLLAAVDLLLKNSSTSSTTEKVEVALA